MRHRRLTTQSRGRLARTRKPPLTSNVSHQQRPKMLGRSGLLASQCVARRGFHAQRLVWWQAVHRQRLAPSSSPSWFRVPAIIAGGSSATFTVAASEATSSSFRVLHLSLPWAAGSPQVTASALWLQALSGRPAGGTLAPSAAMCRPLANPSVKGTSRTRAAPYVER